MEGGVEQVGREGPLAFFLDDYQDDHQVPEAKILTFDGEQKLGREQIAYPWRWEWKVI